MRISIPNAAELVLETLILDLNGTLTIRGKLVEGVESRIQKLKALGLRVVLLSGDTRGTAASIADNLEIELVIAGTGEEKRSVAETLGASTAVALGNGLIDVPLFHAVRLSIAILQIEGLHTACLQAADIVCTNIIDALDLLLDPQALASTLRP
jgi:P-type E1-E2 ATPase